MDPHRTPEIAEDQYGVFSRAQAYAGGWTSRQVRRRIEVGHWAVVAGVALGPAGLEVGPRQLAFAVRLTWPDAVISHELAGALWGFPLRAVDVGTATVGPDQIRRGDRLRARRSVLPPHDTGRLGALRVTTLDRTAIDLLASLRWSEARNLYAWLSTRHLLDQQRLGAAITCRKGLAGSPQLRRLLRVSATGSLSAAEDQLHRLLREANIGGWAANVPVQVNGRIVAVVDVLFTSARVVIEVDGWSTHGNRESFQRDRTHQNELVAAGFVVLRFTWEDLTRRPEYVVRTVRRALAR